MKKTNLTNNERTELDEQRTEPSQRNNPKKTMSAWDEKFEFLCFHIFFVGIEEDAFKNQKKIEEKERWIFFVLLLFFLQ